MRVPAICGRRFETMADYIRHLPGCPLCLMAHMRRREEIHMAHEIAITVGRMPEPSRSHVYRQHPNMERIEP